MANVIASTKYYSIDGTEWVVNLITTGTQGGNVFNKIELPPPGFTISYRYGSIVSVPGMMSSSMSFTAILNNAELSVIDDIVFSSSGEFNLAVTIERLATEGIYTVEWVGVVHPEEFSYQISSDNVVCDFQASCGLAALKGIDFKDENGDIYTGLYSYEELFRLILSKSPTWSFLFDEQGTRAYFKEVDLPVPTSDTFSYGITETALDKWKVRAEDFYRKVERTEFRATLGERKLPRRTDFVSCYEVLSDCISALNISLCQSNGQWVFFSQESIANHAGVRQAGWFYVNGSPLPSGTTFGFTERDLNEEGAWVWAGGANRRGLFPINASSQERVGGGSDLIYAAGMDFNTGSSPLYSFDGALPPPFTSYSFKGESPMPVSGLMENLIINNGNNGGKLRFKIGGKLVNSTGFYGTNIFRFRLQVSDGVNSWRLRRLVRTLNYSSTGSPFAVNVSGTSYYFPKFYENYSWVKDDDPNYSVAFVEYMIGSDGNILVSGTTSQFLSEDFPDVDFFTPTFTTVQSGETNVLEAVEDADRGTFIYRIDEVVQTPFAIDGLSSSITSVVFTEWSLRQAKTNFVYHQFYDSSGNETTITSLSQGEPDLYDSNGNSFMINAAKLWGDDGTKTANKRVITFTDEDNGTEVLSLPSTSVGSSYTNLNPNANGRLYGVAPNGSIEDNVYVTPRYESNELYEDSLEYSTAVACKMYRKTSQVVNGTLYRTRGSKYIAPLYPWQRIKYKGLDNDNTEYFIPSSLSFSLSDREQNLELIRVGVDKVIKPSSTKTYEEDSLDGVAPGLSVDSNIISSIGSKASLVQTTSPITDADLGGGGTAEIDQLFPIFISRNNI